jgi:hypothetical protein
MNHIPAPDMTKHFEQQRPAEFTRLVHGSKFTGQLIYANQSGETVYVPNVWYNQPLEWQAEYQDFQSTQAAEMAVKHLRNDRPIAAGAAQARSEQYSAMAAELRIQECLITTHTAPAAERPADSRANRQ